MGGGKRGVMVGVKKKEGLRGKETIQLIQFNFSTFF